MFYQYASENFGMILVGFRALLKQLYKRNIDEKRINELTRVVAETRGQVQVATQMAEDATMKAIVDSKTGIPNITAYTTCIADLSEKPGIPMALLIFDIDKFKEVNDNYSYDAGDRVIKTLAAVIRDHSREDGKYFRWGGEEFVVLIPLVDGWNEEEVVKMADAVRQEMSEIEFSETLMKGGKMQDLKKTCSCGISFGLTDDLSGNGDSNVNGGKLFKIANASLKDAKDSGRNRIVVNKIER